MAEEEYQQDPYWDFNVKIRNIEEKQRILKDKIALIGQNLIETREEMNNRIIELKKEMQTMKESVEKVTSFLETASEDMQKFAKKEDVDILAKQLKMFQPLEYLNSVNNKTNNR